ncbi:MAG: methyl-accepting chemotaxis protein [Leptospirales bacterium]|jgi:methyl-accepting chemotaxis protein
MPLKDQSKTADQGPVLANRVRMGLVVLFYATSAMTVTSNTAMQNICFFGGTTLMLAYAVLSYVLNRRGELKPWMNYTMLSLDVVLASIVVAAGTLGTPEEASGQLRSQPLYGLFFFFILYSAFLFSRNFVLWIGFLCVLGQVAGVVVAVEYGVILTEALPERRMVGFASISDQVVKVVFLIGATFTVRSVIALLTRMQSEVTQQHQETLASYRKVELSRNLMQESSHALRHSIESVRSFVDRFSEELQSQAATFEEISAAVEEFSHGTERSADSIRNQYSMFKEITGQNRVLERTLEAIVDSTEDLQMRMKSANENGEKVTVAIEEVHESIQEITNSFSRVSQINDIMTEIADRTNLLALNASIEAARAGDAGRGFSVVAHEVGRLAETNSTNAGNISEIIHESETQIERGTAAASNSRTMARSQISEFIAILNLAARLNDEVATQKRMMDTMQTSVVNLTRLSQDLDAIADEQRSGGQSIIEAITQLDSGVTELVRMSRDMQGEVHAIESQAQKLATA